MEMILGIVLLLTAVVVQLMLFILFTLRFHYPIYQIIAGILLASLPTEATNFTMHPELFHDGDYCSFNV